MPSDKETLLGALAGASAGIGVIDEDGNLAAEIDVGNVAKIIINNTHVDEFGHEITSSWSAETHADDDPGPFTCMTTSLNDKFGENEDSWWVKCVNEPAAEAVGKALESYINLGRWEVETAWPALKSLFMTMDAEASELHIGTQDGSGDPECGVVLKPYASTPADIDMIGNNAGVKAYEVCTLLAEGPTSEDGTEITLTELDGCIIMAKKSERIAMQQAAGDYVEWKVYQEGDPNVKTSCKVEDDRIVCESVDVAGKIGTQTLMPTKVENKVTNASSGVTKALIEDDLISEYMHSSEGKKTYTIDEDDIMSLKSLSKTYQVETHTNAEYVGYDYGYWSDERLKENIRDLPESKIMQLKPRLFTQKGEERAFLVADEVEKVFPNAVKTADNGYKAMSTKEIIAHLVKEVQELRMELDALKVV